MMMWVFLRVFCNAARIASRSRSFSLYFIVRKINCCIYAWVNLWRTKSRSSILMYVFCSFPYEVSNAVKI